MRLTIARSLAIAALLFAFLVAATMGLVFLKVDRRVTIPGVFTYRQVWPVVTSEPGFVREILVGEDSLLKKGDPILSLRNDELEGEIQRARARLAIYEIELQQILDLKGFDTTINTLDATHLREELAYRRERLDYLASDMNNARDLLARKLGSRKDYDEANLAHKEAASGVSEIEIQLTQMDKRLAELDTSTRLRYELKKREYEIEADVLAELGQRREGLVVRAGQPGRLVANDLDRLQNAWLVRGSNVGDVVSFDDINFEGYARGQQVVRLAAGQEVYFNVELFRRRQFVRGIVRHVGHKPLERDGIQGFPVEIEVTDKRFFDRGRELYIQAGVPGEAVIITEAGLSLAAMVWEKIVDRLDPY